jgi:Dolichyl-phosphate-mannose-protein mannosyltransferase
MNDRPSRMEDRALHIAAGKRLGEAEMSAGTAAQWRRRVRAHEIRIPRPDEPDHAAQARIADYSAAPVLERPRVEARPDPPSASGTPIAADVVAIEPPPPRRPRGTAWNGHGLLLLAVVTIQIVLSLRLVWTNSAYIDEATYLWAGHLELAHWLHGTAVPPFQTWLSGAPVIYPPIAALANSAGGLVAARLLSLAFMTGATILLWGVTSRLFGARAAFFATALFAVLGPTQFLGALATYDAMALLLLTISAWCVVAAREHDDSTLLLVAAVSALALANATKYATALFDPVIVALAALVIAEKYGVKAALGRAGYIAASVTGLVAVLLALGGPLYLAGIMYTTLGRAAGGDPPALVLADSSRWVGIVWVLAWIGVLVCWRRRDKTQAWLLTVMAVAGMLAPMEQARIHTITSLHKHVDFGAWLAAPAAGYALAQLSRIGRRGVVSMAAAGLVAAAFVPVGAVGSAQAEKLFRAWPESAVTISQLRSLTRMYPGNFLAEDYDIPAYYLERTVPWRRWSDTWYFSYVPPGAHQALTGEAAFRAAIARHHFSLIILDFLATPGTDAEITADMQQAGGYQVAADLPFSFGHYTIWIYRPRQHPEGQHGHR